MTNSNNPEAADVASPRKRRLLLPSIAFFIAALAAAACFRLSLPTVPCLDAFYHLGHARLYAQQGPLTEEFPWTAYSVIRLHAADLWYGFHLLLIPFTFLPEVALQIKLSSVFVLLSTMGLFYCALRRNRVCCPYLWPILMLLISPALLVRLLMTRPHVLDLGLLALLAAFLLRGSAWAVGLVALAIAFVHLNLVWAIPLVVLATLLVKFLVERQWEWPKLLAALAGGVLGWLLRPNPFGAAKLLYVQIVDIAVAKARGLPLTFGCELGTGSDHLSLMPPEVRANMLLFLALWALASAISLVALLSPRLRLAAHQRTVLWTNFLLSLVFLLITYGLCWRGIDLWVPFSLTLLAAVLTFVVYGRSTDGEPWLRRPARGLIVALGAMLFAFTAWHVVGQHSGCVASVGAEPYRLRAAAEWLREHAEPGEIVFNNHWDLFPELFFWNPRNYYIGGMDPIFQYRFDPQLYWKAHHLDRGSGVRYTWGAPERSRDLREDTYTVLRDDFHASYIVVATDRTPNLYRYLRDDPRFALGYEGEGLAVFELLPPQQP